VVVLIAGLGVLRHSNGWLVLVAGVTLFAAATTLSWLGQSWGRAVWPGYLAGAVPLLIPGLPPQNAVCWIGGSCWSWCTLLCPISGLIAGIAVGTLATKQEDGRLSFLAAATLVAGATGVIGCAFAGFLGIMGMIVGGLVGLIPVYSILSRIEPSPRS
jgi:hypothetical protein